MKTIFLFTMVVFVQVAVNAQENRLALGLEQDVLPYVLGGYFGNGWVGKGHVRARVLVARVHKPDFLIPSTLTNNRITAFALLGDYFIKNGWQGMWVGGGLVKWQSSMQDKATNNTAHFGHWLLNGSVGYNWHFFKHFYVSPWAGLHVRAQGHSTTVGAEKYQLPLLNPEASVKIGWYFYP